MEIRPVDMVAIVEQTSHGDREQPQRRRQQQRKKDKIPTGPVYTAHGTLEEEPTPKIDVLV